jgi:hypothetical protein
MRSFSVVEYDTVDMSFWASDPRDRLRMRDELSAICQFACIREESSKGASLLIFRFFHCKPIYPEYSVSKNCLPFLPTFESTAIWACLDSNIERKLASFPNVLEQAKAAMKLRHLMEGGIPIEEADKQMMQNYVTTGESSRSKGCHAMEREQTGVSMGIVGSSSWVGCNSRAVYFNCSYLEQRLFESESVS